MSTFVLQTFHKDFSYNRKCQWILPIGVNGYCGSNFLKDNEGDEISSLNAYYCELTAQYWAWKNCHYENIGFFHYRRYMNFLPSSGFDDNFRINVKDAEVVIPFLTSFDQKKALEKLLSVSDVIVPMRVMLNPSISDQYCRTIEAAPWHEFVRQLKIKFPLSIDPELYFGSVNYAPLCNLFVMKRMVFLRYCEDLFSVIDLVYDKIGTPYDDYNNRYPGFLAERFLGYWLYIQDVKKLEVPMVVIE